MRTTRGDTCLQLGRVQGGQLGSLGIDDAWDDDHRFHAISPSARDAQNCGSTDAAGHGFVNVGILGENASANLVGDWITGPQASGCRLPVGGGSPSRPRCPRGANRIIFFGLLGPDAVNVTYRTPGGELATLRTVGGVGAYLLVFRYDAATCAEYAKSASCDGMTGGVSPELGAITKITYTHGRTCRLESLGIEPRCPTVGWVPFKASTVTAAQVATPIHVRLLPAGAYGCPNRLHLPDSCDGLNETSSREIPVEWSFRARVPVTSSRSWYEGFLQPPSRCGGGQGFSTNANVHAGQLLSDSTFLAAGCHGTYRIAVGFLAQAPPAQADGGAVDALGRDGSIIVGRARFTIR